MPLQVVNAQAANAVAVFISNTENTGFMRMNPDDATPGFDPPTISIPSASLPRNSARPMFAALTSGQVCLCTPRYGEQIEQWKYEVLL